MKRFVILMVLLLVGVSVFAATESVAIVYNGRTRVNSDALRYLQGYLQQSSIRTSITNSTASIQPGDYDAIVVLSTGYRSGLDPQLEAFVNGYSAPDEIILVSLQAGSDQVFVDVARAGEAGMPVDAVSSASTWVSRSVSARQIRSMHDEWLRDVVSLVQEKA